MKLEENGSIYKRDGNYYYLNEYITGGTDINKDEVSIIDMIKNNMLQERIRERDYISFLKDQIIFFKEELREKNKII